MSDSGRSPAPFMLSLTIHGAVVALALFFSYAVSQKAKNAPKVFELVAGAGDNYMATEAPALGVPGGVKLELPTPPAPQPEPTPPAPTPPVAVKETVPEPSPVTPVPIEKAPPQKAPPKSTDKPVPDIAKSIRRQIIVADSKAKMQIKKEREKEAKIPKEAFDRENKAKAAAAAKSGATKVAKIDTEGIREGVIGGSTKNTKGGAGGKALVAEDGARIDRYFSHLRDPVKKNHEKPDGLSDTLVAQVEFYVGADGSISQVHISRPSGSPEFDRSVLEAFARTKSVGLPHRIERARQCVWSLGCAKRTATELPDDVSWCLNVISGHKKAGKSSDFPAKVVEP